MAAPVLRVLLVEDHSSTNDILSRVLRRAGHTVTSARNGEEAVKASLQGEFDLLICDIGLPDTNGWELLAKLRARQPALLSIALTGYGFPNDIKRSREVGFDRHLTKPAEWPAIQATIASLFPPAAAGVD
jgi:CheY-like chemotaxis protein